MKYVVLIGDGMADYRLKALRFRTPLEAARTPNMDWIAAQGAIGLTSTIPKGMGSYRNGSSLLISIN